MADPHLQIKGEGGSPRPWVRGGGRSQKKFFWGPRASPLDPSLLMTWLVLDQTNTLTQKGAKRRRNRAERRQSAVRRFTQFDSTHSFSLEYDLCDSAWFSLIPSIVASLTSRSASVFYPLASYDKEWPYLVYPALFQFYPCFSSNNKWTGKAIAPSKWRQKRRGRDARMLSCFNLFHCAIFHKLNSA